MSIIVAIFALIVLMAVFGLLLGFFAQKFKVEGDPLAEKIEAVLPQTQCGQCGFPGCKPYAQAIANGEADINRCPPGGQEGVEKLADLLGVEPKPLDEERGVEKPPQVAFIIEDWCIGCTRCIKACPVDAILGSNQKMHTIIANECTGCELCVEPCPVNCIVMKPRDATLWQWQAPNTGESDASA
ncbi:Nitrogen fixation protein rnfB [Suttonella ornithocola]|uniref:Ion-translocating oxidoreductase complex subunit B n=1 Tax=Suttonella ornithocola TaxID=279832 RepID=A0A380MMG4_9GAMM|nr:electron transport complex subunit RsxB [Suttonella ornithocola]SUO93438.1 Nitrogen fixation protein rnfB [Suttonella ornithocola]